MREVKWSDLIGCSLLTKQKVRAIHLRVREYPDSYLEESNRTSHHIANGQTCEAGRSITATGLVRFEASFVERQPPSPFMVLSSPGYQIYWGLHKIQ
jgi:hypothetical protein